MVTNMDFAFSSCHFANGSIQICYNCIHHIMLTGITIIHIDPHQSCGRSASVHIYLVATRIHLYAGGSDASNKPILVQVDELDLDGLLKDCNVSCTWPIFCLLLRVSSDYAQPITGQGTEVTCPVIGRAHPELTPSKRQKTGPGCGRRMLGVWDLPIPQGRRQRFCDITKGQCHYNWLAYLIIYSWGSCAYRHMQQRIHDTTYFFLCW